MWRKSAKNPKISLKKISHHPRITSRIYLKKIYTVNSSKFLSPNVWADDLWSRNLCSFATAKKKRDIYLLRFIAVASVKLTRFKIAADILMAFAGEFFSRRNRRHRVAIGCVRLTSSNCQIQNKRATKGFILIRHKRYQIYTCLEISSSIASFVWKPAHFELRSYGGAWRNTKIASVEK